MSGTSNIGNAIDIRGRRIRTNLLRFLGVLVQQGLVVKKAAPTELSPVELLEQNYRRYLHQERRLAAATIVHYLDITGRFLRHLYGRGEVRLDFLCPTDILQFVKSEAVRVRAGRTKFVITALRSFLRYARYRDLIGRDLHVSIPGIANWSVASIPKAISHEQVERLLAHCDRQTPARERAILLPFNPGSNI